MPDKLGINVSPVPTQTTTPQSANANPAIVRNDENSQLIALRSQVIKAYGNSLPLEGNAKKNAIEIFSKILDEKNIKRIFYAERQGDTGYRFKEILSDLLKRLGGAESERGKVLVAALRNSLNLNFSISALVAQPTQPDGNVKDSRASGTPLSILASDVAPTAQQQGVFRKDPSLINTAITKENAASNAVLLISSVGSNADFRKALSADGNKILAAIDPKKQTIAQLLQALDQAIDASPEAAAFLAPYKAAITKLLAAENASTGALMDVPQGQQPDPATPPDTSPDMPATTPATA
jgi:hypothetical protein